MKPGKETRINDLESILRWEGELDNPRIREVLGVQPVWASRLLAELATRMGDLASRSTSHAPLRIRTNGDTSAVREVIESSPDDYLRIVSASAQIQTGIVDGRHDLSLVHPQLFATVNRAVRTGTGLKISYRSMNNPEGTSRVIFPHALIRTRQRWHVRAWCTERCDFRDFTLGRMGEITAVNGETLHGQKDDIDWVTMVFVKVAAHPVLSQSQQRMIEDEYFLGERTKTLSMRRCLVGYTVQDLNIAIDVNNQQPPAYLMSLEEPDAVLPLFRSARQIA